MAGAFLSTSYELFAADLERALAWMQSLGIVYERTRIGEYKRAIDTLINIYETDDEKRIQNEFSRIVTAAFEANDLIAIHKGLACSFDAELRSHIGRYVKGPSNYTQEITATSSNAARNIGFELLVMTKLVSAGIDINFEIKTDVAAHFDNRSIIFECKRPQSLGKLGENVKDAFRQLETKYRNPVHVRHRGIVAIDISKLINPNFLLYEAQDENSLDAGLSKLVDNFIIEHNHLWQTGRNKKTIAVLLRLSLMGINNERGNMLTYCQQFGLTPLNHTGEGNITTVRALTKVLAGT
ncbi:MAG: hypothetical protein HYZ46_09955 [Nitrosomonadales bacterium]|nr:hypothetical protein [Nitrosomonadales bacterium]